MVTTEPVSVPTQNAAPSEDSFCSKISSFPRQIKNAFLGNTDEKVHGFVIVGRILQAISIVLCTASLTCIFFLGPLSLIGLVPAFVIGALGTFMAERPDIIYDWFHPLPPFVPGQPIGLINGGANCWANSGLQLLMNAPALLRAAEQFPEIKQLSQAYLQSQTEQKRVLQTGNSQSIREFLHRETNGRVAKDAHHEDVAELFERIFQGEQGLYNFDTEIDGAPARQQRRPFVSFEVGSQGGHTFEGLLNNYFTHGVEDVDGVNHHQHQLFFPQAPNDLLIQVKRFYQEQVPDANGALVLSSGANNHEIPFPVQFALPAATVRGGGAHNYTCDGFIIHSGGLDCGHYTSYIKKGDQWWSCNDGAVSQVSTEYATNAMKHGYFYHFHKA